MPAMRSLVGASSLAMDVNDDGGWLDERGVYTFFASKLAPTGGRYNRSNTSPLRLNHPIK
ncbi:hypothetical protein D3C84_638630 [compost metagenome]|nr:hypothetical protein BSF44_26890 [Pseudomonas sp. ACN8]